MRTPAAIGIDVGGTTVKGLAVTADGTVLADAAVPTPVPDPTGERTVQAVARCVGELPGDATTPLGVAVPGVVDVRRGIGLMSANVGWRDLPIAALLTRGLGRPIAFGHDVGAGGLAEIRSLEGVRGKTTAFVALGTGISAALFFDGVPMSGDGWAGEIGQLVLPDGPNAGRRVEEVAGAASLARRAGVGGADEVVRRVEAGDERACALWGEAVGALALGLAALAVSVHPQIVVLGGGLAQAGETLFGPARAALARLTAGLPLPEFRPATHGTRAGALGAAILALEPTAQNR